MTHSRLIDIIATIIASLLPGFVIAFLIDGRTHLPIELAFIFILLQSSTLAFGFGGPLFKVYFSFSYFFFGLAPYLEFKRSIIYWGGGEIYDSTYLLTNALIIFLNFLFFYWYFLSRKFKPNLKSKINKKGSTLKLGEMGIIATGGVVFGSLIILLHINNYSTLSLLFRGGEHKELIDLDGPIQTIIQSFFRFLPMVMFTAYMQFSHRPLLPTLILALAAIIAASPLGMPRFMVAALYLPLLFTLAPKLIKGNHLPALLFIALILIFPLLNEFRNFTSVENFALTRGFDFMLEGHFDSYQSLARILQENLITWGWQLLGVILFFVPRTFWGEKPIGTGAETAKQVGYDFSNVSANFYTEGYVNFGLAGCFVFCLILAHSCSRLDHRWIGESNKTKYYRMVYYSAVGYMFFILRGDLLSAVANGVSLILANIFVFQIVVWASNKGKPSIATAWPIK